MHAAPSASFSSNHHEKGGHPALLVYISPFKCKSAAYSLRDLVSRLAAAIF